MASKTSNQGKEKLIDEEEEPLQAVILADSFNKRFRPLTTRKPRCLLPICNAPLLDWTFESLALAGVQEVFVICRSHAELVKNAIKESKWSKPGSGMKIVPIMTAKETFSPGDAMRDIYTRGLVTSDFVLVMGDLVSNIRIDDVVRVHKERRKTNKDAIMTMVVKESGINHRTRARGESSIFVYDPESSECLHYQHMQGHPRTHAVQIPREILASHPELEIRNDLIDCSIDVCSVEVPSLFQDNFDYLDIRRDFVHGILTSDLLMKSIHLYVAEEGYAARVQDTRSYESISKDILSRWTFPLVPDDNHPGGHVYEHTRGNRYIAKDNTVVLARTCNVGTNTLIGSSTQVSENSKIVASVIGRSCTIGAGAVITNSYIFEGTDIGANCIVERSIIGAGVKLKDNSRVPKGCLIGDGVVVGPNAMLEPYERLSIKQAEGHAEEADEDEDSDIEEVEALQDSIDKSALGKDSNAIVWPRGPPDEEDDEEGPENWKNQRFMRLGDSPVGLYLSDTGSSTSDEDTSSDNDDDFYADRESLSGRSDVSMPSDMPLPSNLMADAEFRTEVDQSLERAFAEGHSVDNAAVELKTLRMASNVPLSRVKEGVIAGIVEKIPVVDSNAVSQRKEIARVISRWGDLINRIGGVDPVETISILQAHVASSTRMPLFGQILAALYQEDIVDEGDIRAWHTLSKSKGGGRKESTETDNFKKCWMVCSHMIQQFDAQETSSESEDEEPVPMKTVGPGAASPTSGGSDSDGEDSEDEKPVRSITAPEKSPSMAAESIDSDDSRDEPTPAPATFGKAAAGSHGSEGSEEDETTPAPAVAPSFPGKYSSTTAESDKKPTLAPEVTEPVVPEKAVSISEDSDDGDSEDEEPIPMPAIVTPTVPGNTASTNSKGDKNGQKAASPSAVTRSGVNPVSMSGESSASGAKGNTRHPFLGMAEQSVDGGNREGETPQRTQAQPAIASGLPEKARATYTTGGGGMNSKDNQLQPVPVPLGATLATALIASAALAPRESDDSDGDSESSSGSTEEGNTISEDHSEVSASEDSSANPSANVSEDESEDLHE